MLYLLNSAALFANGRYCRSGPLDLRAARALAAGRIASAVGHHATARWLSELLERPVPACRRRVDMQPGDRALVYRLLSRLPEGRVVDLPMLKKQPYQFSLLVRES